MFYLTIVSEFFVKDRLFLHTFSINYQFIQSVRCRSCLSSAEIEKMVNEAFYFGELSTNYLFQVREISGVAKLLWCES